MHFVDTILHFNVLLTLFSEYIGLVVKFGQQTKTTAVTMKKITSIFALLLLFASCSTDDDSLQTDTAVTAKKSTFDAPPIITSPKPPKYTFACWSNPTAHYDNVGSFASPKWGFIADIPAGIAPDGLYKVTLQIQQIEPENLEVGIGSIISCTDNIVYNNVTVTPPSVARYPYQLMLYYRWRLVVSQVSFKDYSTIICSQSTPWYDTPLG